MLMALDGLTLSVFAFPENEYGMRIPPKFVKIDRNRVSPRTSEDKPANFAGFAYRKPLERVARYNFNKQEAKVYEEFARLLSMFDEGKTCTF